MKQFSELISERLKLNKDTKIKKENILNINNKDSFKCCTIKRNYLSSLFFNNLQYSLICDKKPTKEFDNKYEIVFHWIGPNIATIDKFTLCYYPDIKTELMCLFYDEFDNTLFILFKSNDEAKHFIDNYDKLYKDEIKKIYEEYIKLNENI